MLSRRNFLRLAALGAGSGFANQYGLHGLLSAQTTPHFYIPPTIQHVTENSAILYFRVGRPTTQGLVRVSQDGQMVQEIAFEATGSTLRQQFIIEGLEPATTYQYEVLVDGQTPGILDLPDASWEGLEFRTPPFEWPLRVAAVGDSGFGDKATYALAEKMGQHTPDLFFHLGDVAYWLHEHNNQHFLNWYLKYFLPFAPMLKRTAHYPTFGNHELDSPAILDEWPSYYWIFPPITEDNHLGARAWYSFDINGIQFLSLNSQLFYSYGDLIAKQEAWLDEKLARTDVRYTIPFFHVSPFTSSAPHQWDGTLVAQNWIPKFEAANIPLVISAHAHVYERVKHNGKTYIVAGSGSATIYGEGERLPQTVTMWRLPAYPIFDFYEDKIQITTRDADDNILDEAEILV